MERIRLKPTKWGRPLLIALAAVLALGFPVDGRCGDGSVGPTSTASVNIRLRVERILEPSRDRRADRGDAHSPCVRSNDSGATFNLAAAGPGGVLRYVGDVRTADTFRSKECTPIDLREIAGLKPGENVVVFIPAA